MWVCEHCTFHNPINVHICGVCYRTTDNAEVVNVGGKDEEVENGKDESSLQEVDEAEEKGEKGVAEDREKDPFISFLTELRDEMTPIRPPSFDDDDDGDEELWETGEADDKKDNGGQTGGTLIGERIIGSQKQVIIKCVFFLYYPPTAPLHTLTLLFQYKAAILADILKDELVIFMLDFSIYFDCKKFL